MSWIYNLNYITQEMEVVMGALQHGTEDAKLDALMKFNQTYENYSADGISTPAIESKLYCQDCAGPSMILDLHQSW